MMSALYRQEGAMMQVEILREPEVLSFIDTHAATLNSTFAKVDMSERMRSSLEKSNWVFSGMKTFHELHEAFPSLLNENGERKPFERFLNDVRKVDETYNQHYLRAEYNFVTASAEMAAKWEQIEEDGDRYHLQYRTAGDDKVREEHASLHGITLPPSDDFWSVHYPPNGWNCRCTAVQVLKSRYPQTPAHEVAQRQEALAQEQARRKGKSEMFRFNSGKERKAFPDYNPYTIRRCNDCDLAKGKMAFVPENEVCAGCKLIRTIDHETRYRHIRNKEEYERLKNNPEYKDVEYNIKSGGVKATHVEHNFDKKKGWYEKSTQNAGFLNGFSVILEKEAHNILYQKQKEGIWDGLPFEIAGAETATENNILRALKHCAKKEADVAVIFFPNKNFSKQVFEQSYSRFFGLKKLNDGQFREFKKIYCIHQERIIYVKSQANN